MSPAGTYLKIMGSPLRPEVGPVLLAESRGASVDDTDEFYDRYWMEGVNGWQVAAGLSESTADLLRSVCQDVDVLDFGCGDGLRYSKVIKVSATAK